MHVLLIDDDRADRTAVKRVCATLNDELTITETDSVSAALTAIADQTPDIVFLDYQMPDIDGFDGLNQLRENYPFLPIVMVTGFGSEVLAARAIIAGADDYIPKGSISKEQLEHAITTATAKARLRQTIFNQQQELEQFAHMLSHDLRAPLGRIRSFAELVVDDVQARRFDDLPALCEQLENAAEDAMELVTMLTGFLQSPDLTREPLQLQALVEEAAAVVQSEQPEANAVIDIDSMSASLNSSRPLLLQIFQNLIGNALKYNRDPRPRVEVRCEASGAGYKLHFIDNGIGIDPADQAGIFEPFVRLHGDSEFRGTGLGLAICRKNINRLGGSLTVSSQGSGGSCFTLWLPDVDASLTTPV